MQFQKPVPDLAELLAMPFFSMVPIGTPVNGIDYEHPIPNAGPYYLVYHNNGWEAIVKRNPNYTGARPHQLDGIVYDIGIDTGPAAQLVEQGKADYASESDPDYGVFAPGQPLSSQFSGPRRPGRPWYAAVPEPGTLFFAFNNQHGIFRDTRMRRAVSLAIDRPALAAIDDAAPTDEPAGEIRVLAGTHVYPVGAPTAADLAKAQALLDHRRLHAILDTCARTDCAARATLLTTDLARIGIRLTAHKFENQYGPSSGYDLIDTGWLTDEYDPIDVFGGAMFSDPARSPMRDGGGA